MPAKSATTTKTAHNKKTLFFAKFLRGLPSEERKTCVGAHATKVAVKCLKDGANEEEYSSLAAELKIMIRIGQHKNIVNILGIIFTWFLR